MTKEHLTDEQAEPAYERCPTCDGSGMELNMIGEPGICSECKGDTVVPAEPAARIEAGAGVEVPREAYDEVRIAFHKTRLSKSVLLDANLVHRLLYGHTQDVPSPAPSHAAVPAGYKLVPIEPTEEMRRAAFDVLEIDPERTPFETGTQARDAVYAAMLAASPDPAPVQDAGVQEAAVSIVSMVDDWYRHPAVPNVPAILPRVIAKRLTRFFSSQATKPAPAQEQAEPMADESCDDCGLPLRDCSTIALICLAVADEAGVAVENAVERFRTRIENVWRERNVSGRYAHPPRGDVEWLPGEKEAADEAFRLVMIRAENAEAEVERLREALEKIAGQKKTDELDTEYDVEVASFEDGYDLCVEVARAALTGKGEA